jgi:hypothetical protein
MLYKSSSFTSGSLGYSFAESPFILNLEFKQFIYTLFSASDSISTNESGSFLIISPKSLAFTTISPSSITSACV